MRWAAALILSSSRMSPASWERRYAGVRVSQLPPRRGAYPFPWECAIAQGLQPDEMRARVMSGGVHWGCTLLYTDPLESSVAPASAKRAKALVVMFVSSEVCNFLGRLCLRAYTICKSAAFHRCRWCYWGCIMDNGWRVCQRKMLKCSVVSP